MAYITGSKNMRTKVNEKRKAKCNIAGKINEFLFPLALMHKSSYATEFHSTKEQDWKEKWDLCSKDHETDSYRLDDIKSPCKIGGRHFPNYGWAETQDVSGGKGSIYGLSDYICFRGCFCFNEVPAKDFIDIYEEKVDQSKIIIEERSSKNPYDYLYKLRSRKNRKDKMFLFRYKDLPNVRKIFLPIIEMEGWFNKCVAEFKNQVIEEDEVSESEAIDKISKIFFYPYCDYKDWKDNYMGDANESDYSSFL